jgi:hypothetical protein
MLGKILQIAFWASVTAATGIGIFGLIAALGDGDYPLE